MVPLDMYLVYIVGIGIITVGGIIAGIISIWRK